MIDLHSHAIYDVDDGSKNIEQTIRMLKQAQEIGFDAICFTPHYMEDGYRTSKNVLQKKLERIIDVCKWENIKIDLYLGEEVFIFQDLADKLDDILTINDSRYILFELPLTQDVSYLDDVIYRLQSYGRVPILAHPERYLRSAKDFKFLENLAKKGVLLQVNINSLTGHYGNDAKKLATKLIKQDMVAFVATDAHSSAGYLKASEGLAEFTRLVSYDKFMKLTSINPNKILLDLDVEPWQYNKIEQIKVKGGFFVKKLKRVIGQNK